MQFKPTKLFISHASEDKEEFVNQFANALKDAGFEVWFDKWALVAGDSLLNKIGEGLRQCEFGIVVLSKNFFRKKWTQSELDGLFSIETTERKVILPIWKGVSAEEVTAFSPILSGRLGIDSEIGMSAIVDEIRRAIDVAKTVESFSAVENAISQFRQIDRRLEGAKKAESLSCSEEGVQIVRKAAMSCIASVRSHLESLGKTSASIKFNIDPKSSLERLRVWCPYQTILIIAYTNNFTNSVPDGRMYFIISHPKKGQWIDDSSDRDVVAQHDFRPFFDDTLKLLWGNSGKSLTTEQLESFVLEELVAIVKQYHDEAELHRRQRPSL